MQEICRALVPELTDTLNFDFVISQIFSNFGTIGPVVKNFDLRIFKHCPYCQWTAVITYH